MTDPITYTGADGAPSIAVDVQATGLAGEFSVDVDEVGGPALLGRPGSGWVNVVCDVTRLRMRRGATRAQGVLTRAEAAAVSLEILDVNRSFDPLLNADAVHAGTPLRVRAWAGPSTAYPSGWSETLFTGEVDDVPVVYSSTIAPRVTLQATDIIGASLVPWRSAGRADPGVGAGDTFVGRVDRVLAELELVGVRAPTGAIVLSATHPATTLASAWDDITAAADAELGRVYVNRDGKLVLKGRTLEPLGTLRGTLSDWHGEEPVPPHCCYDDLEALLGTDLLTNRAIGERRVPGGVTATPATVQRDDPYSQALYRVRTTEDRSLELETDAQVVAWAEQLLAVQARPELRVEAVNPAPWGAGADAWRAVCATDLDDRWLLRYHPEIGPAALLAVAVLGIDLDVTPSGWAITWQTSSSYAPGDNPAHSFAVDNSELSGADELATFGGPVPALVT